MLTPDPKPQDDPGERDEVREPDDGTTEAEDDEGEGKETA
jgi:hypothetical protein